MWCVARFVMSYLAAVVLMALEMALMTYVVVSQWLRQRVLD